MQQATSHPHAHRARPTTQRLAWLGLGLAATAFVVFEVAKHVALDRALGHGLRSREGLQRG